MNEVSMETKLVISNLKLVDVFRAAAEVADEDWTIRDMGVGDYHVWVENRAADLVRQMMREVKL